MAREGQLGRAGQGRGGYFCVVWNNKFFSLARLFPLSRGGPPPEWPVVQPSARVQQGQWERIASGSGRTKWPQRVECFYGQWITEHNGPGRDLQQTRVTSTRTRNSGSRNRKPQAAGGAHRGQSNSFSGDACAVGVTRVC